MSSTPPGPAPERPHDADEHEPPATEHEGARYDEPAAPAEPVTPAEPAEPIESPDATARLDAAVERANAAPVASDDHDIDETDAAVQEPVPAESVRRETYLPAATVATGSAAGAATLAPEPEPSAAAQPTPQTVYVQAPAPPKSRGNRGFGVFVALIGTVLFAALYAGVAYLLITMYGAGREEGVQAFTEFLVRPVFWVPIVAFFIGFALLAAIVNRGSWWYYAVFGLIIAVLVYFSYLGGSLLTVEAWTLTVEEADEFIAQRWLDPFAIVAFVIAREIPIWLGGWIAARGRTVAERNRLALEAYDRELAAGPQAQRY
jgi:hypothetical protein